MDDGECAVNCFGHADVQPQGTGFGELGHGRLRPRSRLREQSVACPADVNVHARVLEDEAHHVRAVLHEYRFTTPEERRRTGRWWRREPVDYYFPALSLKTR